MVQCYHADPTRCRFCNIQFEDIRKKSKHFEKKFKCKSALRQINVAEMIPISPITEDSTPVENVALQFRQLPNVSQFISPRKDKSTPVKASKLSCRHCRQDFPSKASFSHHKEFIILMKIFDLTHWSPECWRRVKKETD